MRSIAILAILFFTIQMEAQNLIVNPSAEISPLVGNGWTSLYPGEWRQNSTITSHLFNATSNSHYFYAGDGVCNPTKHTSELYQDIDVSSYASNIDAGNATFTFHGFTRNYFGWGGSSDDDSHQIIVEYRDVIGNILSKYDSGVQKYHSWKDNTDTRIAPLGTRTIRIRLLSTCLGSGGDSDGYFDDLSLTVATPAPVTLIYFNATALTNKVELSWATAKEENNDYFTVEKSIDGVYWETLSTIKGLGNSHTNKGYLSYDYNPNIGLQYYRLLQTDIGGKTSIYPTRSVNYMASTGDIYLYKNDQNEVLVHGNGILKVSVYTQDGAFVKRESFEEYTEITELNISQIPQGFFIFSIETANEVVNLKYINK